MNNKLKKSIALLSSLVLTAMSMTSVASNISAEKATSATPLFTAEAEDCEIISGAEEATHVYGKEYPGYSGDSFVWAPNSGGIKFDVTIPENGMYELKTRCWMYLGEIGESRLQTVKINGESIGNFYIPNNGGWSDFAFSFAYLEAGEATIEIGAEGSWGFVLYDTVTFDKAVMPKLDIDPTPVDKDATPETRALMKYMTEVYGKQIISGQQEIYGGGNDGDYELEFDYIYNTTGEYPALRGFDYMNYNPMYGWDDGSTDRIIEWVNDRNGIATICWHINVPKDVSTFDPEVGEEWDKDGYKPKSTFKAENCLDETTAEYAYLMLAIEDLAEQLLILQENNVPVILRPYHEAEGNNNTDGSGAWFWWGTGGAEVYKELWKQLYVELTETYGVHNCIWEVNLYDYGNSAQWYPGDEYVDMVAYDKYEGSPYQWGYDSAASMFLTLVGYTDDKKMVAMAENDKIPSIDNMVNEQAWWSYFCPWYGSFILDGTTNPVAELTKTYTSDYVVTLDELPANLYDYDGEITTKPPTTTTVPSTTFPPTHGSEILYGDANFDGNVNVGDVIAILQSVANPSLYGLTEEGHRNADVHLNGNGVNANDAVSVKEWYIGLVNELPVSYYGE